MRDFEKLRAEVKAKYRAAAKVAHPNSGGSVEDMAAVNAAYDQALKDIDRLEQEQQNGQQTRGPAQQPPSGRSSWTPVHEDPPPPKEYPDTIKGRVHRAYDDAGLSGAIKLAKELGVQPRRFRRWLEDFKFDAEWE